MTAKKKRCCQPPPTHKSWRRLRVSCCTNSQWQLQLYLVLDRDLSEVWLGARCFRRFFFFCVIWKLSMIGTREKNNIKRFVFARRCDRLSALCSLVNRRGHRSWPILLTNTLSAKLSGGSFEHHPCSALANLLVENESSAEKRLHLLQRWQPPRCGTKNRALKNHRTPSWNQNALLFPGRFLLSYAVGWVDYDGSCRDSLSPYSSEAFSNPGDTLATSPLFDSKTTVRI